MVGLKNPKVSIIVPVFNVEKYLYQCVVSIIEQTYKNIEIVLVDDGSSDNSGSICDFFSKIDSRIIVLHQKNRGVSFTRNIGTKRATGDYIMYLDSDDWIEKETCEVAIEAAQKNDAEVVFWSYEKTFAKRDSVRIPLFETDRLFEGTERQWLHRRMIGLVGKELTAPTKTDAFNSPWGKLYRKDIIETNNIVFLDHKEVGSEDVLFNIQVFWLIKKAYYIHRFFNYYRQDTPNALTKTHKSALFPRFLNLFSYIDSFMMKNHLSGDYQIALNNRIALSIINIVLSISTSNNRERASEKRSSIKELLMNTTYRSALNNLNFKFLPFHWKVFFFTCQKQFILLVFVQALIMLKLK